MHNVTGIKPVEFGSDNQSGCSERVMQALAVLESQPVGETRLLRQVADYSMPNVSEKVVRIIHSYVDYVNRVVWKKV